MMYQWLFEKFKGWNPIANEIKKIRKSDLGSHRRQWRYLWDAINSYLEYFHEDSNVAVFKAAMAADGAPPKAKAPGAVGKTKKEKKTKAEKPPKTTATETPVDANVQRSATDAHGAAAKGKGKGKAKGKPQPKKVSGSPSQNTSNQARDEAFKVPAKERTLEQRKLLGCRFHAEGRCTNGNNCTYSHAPDDIAFIKRKMQSAAAKAENQRRKEQESGQQQAGQPPAAAAAAPPAAKSGKARAVSKVAGSVAGALGLLAQAEPVGHAVHSSTPGVLL